ncbi:MBL fold metallo-hydrolase [Ochrobactrum sp. Sa2BUA5]|nr:MBL fold metallo-hydrolase [Ochrobactrum gallinarum]
MILIDLYGGFGEKGRTSVGIRSDRRLLFDAGIKVGAKGRDYYPAIAEHDVAALDAVFISHAHEDHIGGLYWLRACGFQGTFYMTRETHEDAEAMLRQYADPAHQQAHPLQDARIKLFTPGETIHLGDSEILSGRSGHVAGGVWFSVTTPSKRVVYCADVVPNSDVFVMDALPHCDLIILDASYGGDPVSARDRIGQIGDFVNAHSGKLVVPVPLSGKPLELMAILPGSFAIHHDMRRSLIAQIDVPDALSAQTARSLRRKLDQALDWREGSVLPDCPLMTFDGMGSAGPSREALRQAVDEHAAVLLTGHVPENTPAHALLEQGRATWIRLPTHPTQSENLALWQAVGKPMALGHSCTAEKLEELKPYLTSLDTTAMSGSQLSI